MEELAELAGISIPPYLQIDAIFRFTYWNLSSLLDLKQMQINIPWNRMVIYLAKFKKCFLYVLSGIIISNSLFTYTYAIWMFNLYGLRTKLLFNNFLFHCITTQEQEPQTPGYMLFSKYRPGSNDICIYIHRPSRYTD